MADGIWDRIREFIAKLFGRGGGTPDAKEFRRLLEKTRDIGDHAAMEAAAIVEAALKRMHALERRLDDLHARIKREVRELGTDPNSARVQQMVDEVEQGERELSAANSERAIGNRTRSLASTLKGLVSQVLAQLRTVNYGPALEARAIRLKEVVSEAQGTLVSPDVIRGIYEDLKDLAQDLEIEAKEVEEIWAAEEKERTVAHRDRLAAILGEAPTQEKEEAAHPSRESASAASDAAEERPRPEAEEEPNDEAPESEDASDDDDPEDSAERRQPEPA